MCYVENINIKQFAKKDDNVKIILVDKGVKPNVQIVFEQDAGVLLEKGKDKEVEQTITLEESIIAPVEAGQKIGEAIYSLGRRNISYC